MKHMPFIFVFTLMMLLTGCQEKTKTKTVNNSTNPYCTQNPYAPGCPWGTTSGGTSGGSTACNPPTINDKTCSNYCSTHPTGSGCLTNGTNCNINPTAVGCPGYNGGTTTNPWPYYGSRYVEKNWMQSYPFIPNVSCSPTTVPTNISYTPYETRQGTIVIGGKNDYNPASGQAYTLKTSELLRSVDGATDFFWGDSILKVRFKANIQPDSRNTTDVCAGRVPNLSTLKGYTRMKFNLVLVGKKGNTITPIDLGEQTLDINKCTSAINLSSYLAQYKDGIYFRITNVRGNQGWSPTYYPDYREEIAWDTWGFYPYDSSTGQGNRFYNGNSWTPIRSSDCWSIDVEVASDGTKTFN